MGSLLQNWRYWAGFVFLYAKLLRNVLAGYFVAVPIFIVFFGSVGIHSGSITPNQASILAHEKSPWVIWLSGPVCGLIVVMLAVARPKVSIRYDGMETSLDGHIVTASVRVVARSYIRPVRMQVFCTGASPTGKGSQNLHLRQTQADPAFIFTLSEAEDYPLPVITYDWREVAAPAIHVVPPSKRLSDDLERGSGFLVTISAFGDMKTERFQLRCWVHNQKLFVEPVTPSEEVLTAR